MDNAVYGRNNAMTYYPYCASEKTVCVEMCELQGVRKLTAPVWQLHRLQNDLQKFPNIPFFLSLSNRLHFQLQFMQKEFH